jgi:hypothetical protein
MLGAMLLLIGGVGGVDAVPTDDAYVAGYTRDVEYLGLGMHFKF